MNPASNDFEAILRAVLPLKSDGSYAIREENGEVIAIERVRK